jgi:hypothetical protein
MSDRRHARVSSLIQNWMVALADPVSPSDAPAEKLSAVDLALLTQAATLHGVRPIFFRNLEALIAREGVARIVTDGSAEKVLDNVLEEEKQRRVSQRRAEQLLSESGEAVGRALAQVNIAAIRAKGDVFARRLYPHSADRPFGDIDILVRTGDLDRTKPVIQDIGFRLESSRAKGGKAYRLDKWVLERGESLEVEIQANLIHSRKIGSAVGLSFDELLAAGDGDPEAPIALLIVAAVHGAAVHQFDRLQHVIDVLQAVRNASGKIGGAQLQLVAQRVGATSSLQTALDLAAEIYGDSHCRALADQLNAPWRALRRRLVTVDVILRARSTVKRRDDWRRKLLRLLLVVSGRRERSVHA